MKRILIVDDSRLVHADMQRKLKDTEFETAGYCTRGEEALAAYEKERPDIVCLDIILPGMDGFETAEQILSRYPDARIVMISSLAYDETESRAHEIGVRGVVFKPFTREQLVETLRAATGEN